MASNVVAPDRYLSLRVNGSLLIRHSRLVVLISPQQPDDFRCNQKLDGEGFLPSR